MRLGEGLETPTGPKLEFYSAGNVYDTYYYLSYQVLDIRKMKFPQLCHSITYPTKCQIYEK